MSQWSAAEVVFTVVSAFVWIGVLGKGIEIIWGTVRDRKRQKDQEVELVPLSTIPATSGETVILGPTGKLHAQYTKDKPVADTIKMKPGMTGVGELIKTQLEQGTVVANVMLTTASVPNYYPPPPNYYHTTNSPNQLMPAGFIVTGEPLPVSYNEKMDKKEKQKPLNTNVERKVEEDV